MALLTGWIAASIVGGYVNPALTPALHEFEVDYWPAHEAAIGVLPAATLVTHWPVSTTPAVKAGWVGAGFSDDWYHRIHVKPARLDLGNIVSTQVQEVRVWNAYLVPQTLLSIDGEEEGLDITPPHAFPEVYAPLEEQVWPVTVTRDGPSRIDAQIDFLFDGIPSPALVITGGRVVEWAFRPDWTEGITERLAWLTGMQRSPTGAEQRRALRIAPRRAFEARFIVDAQDRALADLALAAWGGRTWALPIWPDVQQLASDLGAAAAAIPCSTEGRDFREGGLVMLIGASPFDVETGQVAGIEPGQLLLQSPLSAAWPAGTLVLPARTADLAQQPALRRKHDRLSVIEATFDLAEPSDWPAELPATLYRGAPVLAERPEESEDLTHSWQRLRETLDNGSSLPRHTETTALGFALHGHRWQLIGRAEHTAWRGLLHGLRGRQVPLWLPTHAEDLVLAATTAADGLAIDVRRCGYTRMLGTTLPAGRRDVRIELSDGSAVHRRITAAVELAGNLERLAIDTAPGVALHPPGAGEPHVTRISWLQLCRLDADEIELLHVTDADGAAQCQVVWRSLRDELELA